MSPPIHDSSEPGLARSERGASDGAITNGSDRLTPEPAIRYSAPAHTVARHGLVQTGDQDNAPPGPCRRSSSVTGFPEDSSITGRNEPGLATSEGSGSGGAAAAISGSAIAARATSNGTTNTGKR